MHGDHEIFLGGITKTAFFDSDVLIWQTPRVFALFNGELMEIQRL